MDAPLSPTRFEALRTKVAHPRTWLSLLILLGALVFGGALQTITTIKLSGFSKVHQPTRAELEHPKPVVVLADLCIMSLISILAIYAIVKGVERRDFHEVVHAYRHFRMGRFALGFSGWGALSVLANGALRLFLPNAFSSGGDHLDAVVRFLPWALLTLALQTLYEELLFRGWFFQVFAGRRGNALRGALGAGALFGLLHMFNPEVSAGGALFGAGEYVLFSALWGYLAWREQGLELTWGMHLANNLCAAMLASSASSSLQLPHLFDEIALPRSADFLALLVMAGLTLAVYRWKHRRLNGSARAVLAPATN